MRVSALFMVRGRGLLPRTFDHINYCDTCDAESMFLQLGAGPHAN